MNTYLYSLGVSLADPSLLKARFAYAGAVALTILAVSFGVPLYGLSRVGALQRFVQRASPPSLVVPGRMHRVAVLAVSFVIPLMLTGVIIGLKRDGISRTDLAGETLNVVGVGFVTGTAICVAVLAAAGRAMTRLPRWSGVVAMTFVALLLLLTFTAFVGQYVYPALPDQFGGGRPKSARLVLREDAINQGAALGLAGTEPLISAEIQILFQSADFLVIRRPDGEIVEVDKTLVAGLLHAAGDGD